MALGVQELRVDRVQLVYLQVNAEQLGFGAAGGWLTYPCASMHYVMSMDSMHAATVELAAGVSVKYQYDVSPEKLLMSLQDPARKTKSLVACRIVEDGDGVRQAKLLLDGYIASTSFSYTGGDPTALSIQVACNGPAALLMEAPASAYVEAPLGTVIDAMDGKCDISVGDALESGESFENEIADVADILANECTDRTMVDRIACCVDLAKRSATVDHTLEEGKLDANVKRALGGVVRPDFSQTDTGCEDSFNEELFQSISGNVLQTNVFNALVGSLCGDEFMLHLIPRWSVDEAYDFRLEVVPTMAWAPRQVLRIKSKDVISLQTDYKHTKVLVTPDIVIANFNESYSFSNEPKEDECASVMGIACLDEELQSQMQTAMAKGDMCDALDKASDKNMRVKVLYAPKWLSLVVANPACTDAAEKNRDTSSAENGEQGGIQQAEGNVGTTDGVRSDGGNTTDPAAATPALDASPDGELFKKTNKVAEALLYERYLATETAYLQINPALRFGSDPTRFFEQHIGDTVEVDLTDTVVRASQIRLRGELVGIQYNFQVSGGASANYALQLARLRFADAKTPASSSPLYTFEPLAVPDETPEIPFDPSPGETTTA